MNVIFHNILMSIYMTPSTLSTPPTPSTPTANNPIKLHHIFIFFTKTLDILK